MGVVELTLVGLAAENHIAILKTPERRGVCQGVGGDGQ